MKKVTFEIDGMHCGGCAQMVKALIEREAGVKHTTVSFEDREARVLYDPQSVTEDRLIAVIERPGYRVVAQRE
jgi:copper chaperone CopZ